MGVQSRLLIEGEVEKSADEWTAMQGFRRAPLVVGTHGRLRTAVLAVSATHTVMEVEHFMYVGNDTPWIAFSADNFYTNNTGGLGSPPTAKTIVKAAALNASRTRLRPIKFDGARNVDIPPNLTIFTDRIQATEFALPYFKRGTKLILKARLSVPANTGQFCTGGTQFNPVGTYASRFDPTAGTNGTDQVDTLTAMTSKTGQTDFAAGWMFSSMIGVGADPRLPVLINADGDSIGQSSNDTAGYGLESGSALLRSSFAADQTRPIPMINMARGSSSVVGSQASAANRAVFFPFCAGGIAISQGGTGDIGPTGSGDIEALKAALLTQWAALRAAGVAKIVRLGILPRADGSGNRVPAFDAKMLAMNVWFQQQLAAGVIDAYLPLNSLRDPGDPTLWKAGMTVDWTHPESVGHVLIQADVRAQIEVWYPQVALA